MSRTLFAVLFVTAVLFTASSAPSASLDTIQYLKISPYDPRAVVRGGDGKMLVVTPGDMIADNATVKEIVPERIIVEEQTAKGLVTVIMTEDNGHVRFERRGGGAAHDPAVAAEKK